MIPTKCHLVGIIQRQNYGVSKNISGCRRLGAEALTSRQRSTEDLGGREATLCVIPSWMDTCHCTFVTGQHYSSADPTPWPRSPECRVCTGIIPCTTSFSSPRRDVVGIALAHLVSVIALRKTARTMTLESLCPPGALRSCYTGMLMRPRPPRNYHRPQTLSSSLCWLANWVQS